MKRVTSGRVPSKDSLALLSVRQGPHRRCLTSKLLNLNELLRIALRGNSPRIGYSGLKLSNNCNFRTKEFAKKFAKKSKLLKISARVSGSKSSTKLTKFLLRSKVETTDTQAWLHKVYLYACYQILKGSKLSAKR